MRDFTLDNLTAAVVEGYTKNTSDPRLRQIMTSLIEHLHAFVKEVELTEEEWFKAIQFLTAVGHKSDDKRQEFILLSDTLGVSMLVDAINHPRGGVGTENTVLGPFYLPGAPELPMGSNLIRQDVGGEPILVRGRITDGDGKPLEGAEIDVWQTAANGLYDVQDPEAPEWNLRGRFRTGADGQYRFVTEKPIPYSIPTDGPVGDLLRACNREAIRPAHIHMIVRAAGHDQLTTHLFFEGDRYLDEDPVFATKNSLVAKLETSSDAALANENGLGTPFSILNWDFRLVPAKAAAA